MARRREDLKASGGKLTVSVAGWVGENGESHRRTGSRSIYRGPS